MFGLTGAHRSGKTTTAKMIADQLGIEFLETKVGQVFADLGLDPKADLPFAQRLDVQNEILKSLEVQYDLRQGKLFIADRTPFDVLGYTLADIKRDTLDDDLRARLTAHCKYAVSIIYRHLAAVMLLRPLSNVEECVTSAQACPFYMDNIYTLIKGQLSAIGQSIPHFLGVENPYYDLNERVEYGSALFGRIKAQVQPEPKIWMPNS